MAPPRPCVVPVVNSFLPTNEPPTWLFDLSTLQCEKELLEDGLANCVTYLQALRKKQARTEQRLVTDPPLPRKKRKVFQHVKRELEKEIKNRGRDEQAFLNNLQACKANIYVAETVSLPSTAISSTLPDFASISTGCSYPRELESVPTEISWNGWSEDTALSPFQKESNNSCFAFDVAPDELLKVNGVERATQDDCKQPLDVQHVENVAPIPCVSSNTPPHLLLSPEAPVFQPQFTQAGREGTRDQELVELDLSSSMAITASRLEAMELLDRRQVGDVDVDCAPGQGSPGKTDDEFVSRTMAKSSPNTAGAVGKLRCRTKSL